MNNEAQQPTGSSSLLGMGSNPIIEQLTKGKETDPPGEEKHLFDEEEEEGDYREEDLLNETNEEERRNSEEGQVSSTTPLSPSATSSSPSPSSSSFPSSSSTASSSSSSSAASSSRIVYQKPPLLLRKNDIWLDMIRKREIVEILLRGARRWILPYYLVQTLCHMPLFQSDCNELYDDINRGIPLDKDQMVTLRNWIQSFEEDNRDELERPLKEFKDYGGGRFTSKEAFIDFQRKFKNECNGEDLYNLNKEISNISRECRKDKDSYFHTFNYNGREYVLFGGPLLSRFIEEHFKNIQSPLWQYLMNEVYCKDIEKKDLECLLIAKLQFRMIIWKLMNGDEYTEFYIVAGESLDQQPDNISNGNTSLTISKSSSPVESNSASSVLAELISESSNSENEKQ